MFTNSSDKITTANYTLTDFRGGMRRNVEASNLEDNEYFFLSNARVRNGNVQSVFLPEELTSQLPAGKMQGLYGYGRYLIAFVAGNAYVRDYSVADSQFAVLPGFSMDATVEFIYAEAVESSWMNLQRQATSDNANEPVNLLTNIAGTPACLVCQDGINRPFLIFPDGNARPAKDIAQWVNATDTEDGREYVPIGKQMLNFGGILYIVSPDGKELYRSVTGRPLDFVIAIDMDGNKLPPLSSGVEASRMSYKVDFNPITCLARISSAPRVAEEGSGFYVSTGQYSYMVIPNFARTVFAEPTFTKQDLFPTGPFNQFSVTDLLGDTATIDASGITSFNSVLQLQNEGKNAPFHQTVFDLFEGIIQTQTAAITSDNYGLFGLNTIFGYGILVYDNIIQRWIALDQYSNVTGAIKQFAETKVDGTRRLFFITDDDKMYQLFASDTIASATLYPKEITAGSNTEAELLLKRVHLVFDNVVTGGNITLTDYTDKKANIARTVSIAANVESASPPYIPPYNNTANDDTTVNKPVPIEKSRKGDKVGVKLTWQFQGELTAVGMIADMDQAIVNQQEQGAIFRSRS